MEAFTLLKYWKGGGITGYSDAADDGDDDGGFFDLEFKDSVLDTDEEVVFCCSEETVEEGGNDEDEVVTAASDGLLLAEENGSEVVATVGSEGKMAPLLLMKPATKLKFLISSLKKLPAIPAALQQQAKQKPREMDTDTEKEKSCNPKQKKKKIFAVRFNVDEVPFVSLFTRDTNGSRDITKEKVSNTTSSSTVEEEVVFETGNYNKDVMRKYLSKIKPLYIRVSKKYNDKLPVVVSSDQSINSSSDDSKTNQTPEEKPEQTALPALAPKSVKLEAKGKGLVRKQFGKSKSASSMVHSIPVQSGKRDDSLLQQEDGIQSAILHCKNSFNVVTTIVDSKTGMTLPPLWRSVSDPYYQKSKMTEEKEDENHVVVAKEV